MFHGSVRAKAKSSTPIRIKICAHGQHFLCAVQTSLMFMVDSTEWMNVTILNEKLRFPALLLLLFHFWLVLWPCTNFHEYLFSIISKSFWYFNSHFPLIPLQKEYFLNCIFLTKIMIICSCKTYEEFLTRRTTARRRKGSFLSYHSRSICTIVPNLLGCNLPFAAALSSISLNY